MKTIYSHNRDFEFADPFPEIGGLETLRVSPKGGATVAMEAIPSWLLSTLKEGDTIVRKVGIARCSDEDNYCRKTGRELAESRMKQTVLTVDKVFPIGERTVVFLKDETGNLYEVKSSSDPYCARLVRMLED